MSVCRWRPRAPVAARDLEFLHQIGGARIQDAEAVFDERQADRCPQVTFPGPGRADQDQVGALVGPPGAGKSHLGAAIGLALIENGFRVLYARTTDLVQKLQVARRELVLEAAICKLHKYHLLILDDIAYVRKDQAETSVLFELISSRYENRSLLVTANQPFGDWGSIFPEQAMTLAAIDRLVHRATIFELNVESYRRRTAVETKRGRGRIASRATPANTKVKLPGGASSKNKQVQENNP